MSHEQRLLIVEQLRDRLLARYGEQVKAIGLYGSLARGDDGHFFGYRAALRPHLTA
ncbi:nucleotidyltransferase family protein [Thermogemmatispora tikiterensis]|uniref:hypothetical protein n=1 Tax=Thermogemmatispora tikiterensis TaxID=1825093 RepID=UPI00167221A7|nr:hypothetical protein [Thermogemmatispora tikiterensis]